MRLRALACTALACTAATAFLSAGPAAAQEGMTLFGRALSVSVKARVAPDYMGSDDYSISPSGSISFSPDPNKRFSAPDDGVSIALFGDEAFAVGLAGRLRSGRDNDDDLRGFEEVDWAVEAGPFVNWWPTDWLRLRAEARRGFGGHEGWVADFGADAVASDGRWTFSAGPRLRWADDEFTQTYFDVTPVEAARSPFRLAPYRAEGGVASAGVLASAEYRWSDRWSVTADADYRRLMGDGADSPIVARLGSEDQFSASIGVRYALGR
jgi:MipA family protein